MAKISIDLMGEVSKEVEVTCFTLPGPGVCISIKTDGNVVEIDLPDKVYAAVMERIGKPEVMVSPAI